MYEFNSCKVCINPERINLTDKSYIDIAEVDEGFIYGFSLTFNTGGRYIPCMLGIKYFLTRQKAIDEALHHVRRVTELQSQWYSNALKGVHDNMGYEKSLSDCKHLLKVIGEKISNKPKPIQLSLFDF